MAINSRRKGHTYEREIVAEFRAKGWIKTCRNIETNPDAVLGVDILHTEPFMIQVKRYADYCPISKIEEIPPVPGTIPLLITKPDDKSAMVVLSLANFLSLISPDSPAPPLPEDF